MKSTIIGLFLAFISLVACNGGNSKSTTLNKMDTIVTKQLSDHAMTASVLITDSISPVSIKEIISIYLQLKNAFTKDNTRDAATAGSLLESTFKKFDRSSLQAMQKRAFEEIEDDAREHAEHIGKNGGNITHQREHFDMLSKDMADLIKALGNGGLTIYKDFCPMYNNGKGAYWISETKDIKNPYFGKAMPTCGVMKEEL
jgi:hypothetical protein